MKTTTITLILAFIVSVGIAQKHKIDSNKTLGGGLNLKAATYTDLSDSIKTLLSNTSSGNYLYNPNSFFKPDTTFCIFLELPNGVDLNPVSWPIERQGEINLIWQRGFTVNDHVSYRCSYLYIDRKTKVKNKVLISFENPTK